MVIPQWLDLLIHVLSGTGGVALLTVAIKLLIKMGAEDQLKKDFPPHMHINGKVRYPRGYEPAPAEQLQGEHP